MNVTLKTILGGVAVPAVLVPLVWVAGCDRDGRSAGTSAWPTTQGPADIEASRPADAATAVSVSIGNFTFDPPTVTVAAGTTVTWVNRDDVPHTVTADDKGFASKTLDTDGRFEHRFTTPGTYRYFCAVHPHMTAQVVVK